MTIPTPDSLHRTLKLELDEGRARSVEEARRLVERYRLQIVAGSAIAGSRTLQAALLTAVAAGARAFPGGVLVVAEKDPVLSVRWASDLRLTDAVLRFGGQVVTAPDKSAPVLRIGTPPDAAPSHEIDLTLTWEGWAAGLVPTGEPRLAESREFPLSGVAAASLAVFELFQHARGDSRAGRRALGISLWEPDVPWQHPTAVGEACEVLPTKLWLIGLGHLGQAYGWGLGMLPYANPAEVVLTLQDTDSVVEANVSTGLLSELGDIGIPKTRVVGRRLEAAGFTTRLIERAFDEDTHPRDGDPSWALGGLDNREARRWAASAGFSRYIDAGIGDTADTYYDVLVQSFPSEQTVDRAFPPPAAPRAMVVAPAYDDLVAHGVRAGKTEAEARCGVIAIAGRAVGASFVGTATAALVLAQLLRELNTGDACAEVISFNLRSPEFAERVANSQEAGANPGFTNDLVPTD
ncbi:hypothetical protein [Lentzea sp. CA-135723]|uniref:hypothetical protein n=1 Tax=Lentzea sp. CA-135723 TaxID=3239950 RepID=UPI003D94BC33